MRALVTGGVGFIGTNLIKRLLSDGHDVVSMDNYYTGKKENEQNGCTYIDIDISDKIEIKKEFEKYKIKKPDIIYHLAAKARIVPSIQNPAKSLFNNIDSTINILEYARNNKVPVVYAGSSSAHGDIYSTPYTFTKWNGEELLVQSRAMDETGYVQPTIDALQAERGVNSIYHNNAIATWLVNKDGSVDNVRLG